MCIFCHRLWHGCKMRWTCLKTAREVRHPWQKPQTFSKFKSALMRNAEQGNNLDKWYSPTLYRVTQNVGQNLPLTSKQKFRFGLA